MNNLRNRVQLIGNLGMDPDMKEINGKSMAKFSLATSETYKNNEGNKITDTQWHNVVVWGPPAGIAQKYLKKGHEVAVEGKLVHRSYDDKDGNKKYISEVVVNEILLLRNGKSENA
jgi:single-strand DNA-binding protein